MSEVRGGSSVQCRHSDLRVVAETAHESSDLLNVQTLECRQCGERLWRNVWRGEFHAEAT